MRTAGWTGGLLRPAMSPTTMNMPTLIGASAIVKMDAAEIDEGEDEHVAHSPHAHPPAGQGAGDGLTDARGGEHEAGGAVGVVDLLDVKKDREREHSAREAGQ